MENSEFKPEEIAALSYEACYGRLQEVVENLEKPDLPLAESLSLYESGMKLAERCGQLLEDAQLRVGQLQPDGTLLDISSEGP